jgi:putative DNA primase/helicase
VERFFPAAVAGERDDTVPRAGFNGTDDALIQRALNARISAEVAFNGKASFADLWHGNAEKNSENDAALIARLLWWCGGDAERVERIALRSGLKREKWFDRRPGGTYLTYTIAEIGAKCDTYYREPENVSPTYGEDGTASATSDLANAARIIRAHGADLMFVPGVSWHIWSGNGPWTQDDHAASRLAFGIGKIVKAEADALDDWVNDETINGSDEQKRRADVQKNLARWARQSEFVVSIRHTLEAAAPMLCVKADELDASPLLVGTPSGVIDLATCTVREHRREDRITKRIACDYDPAARAPTWERFVHEIMGGDAELIDYLQTLVGYIMSGKRGEHLLPVFHGTGANGKSTLLSTLQILFGDYAGTAAPGLLIARNGSEHPTGLAALQGRRLVIVSETGEGGRLNEEQVKQLTGGDRITARRMRQDFYEFDPTHIIVLQTNHKPRVTGTDEGIWRRMKLIPFTVTIPPAKRDANLLQKLAAEFPGILAWAIEGWRKYQQFGFREPTAVRDATADYRSDSDHVGAFIADRCLTGPEYTATASGIYMAYKLWCAENGEHPLTQRSLGLRLSERPGIEQARTKQARTWRGLGIDNHAVLGPKAGPALTVVQG